jgi:hypothetical protein
MNFRHMHQNQIIVRKEGKRESKKREGRNPGRKCKK